MNRMKLINLSLSLAFAMALMVPVSANCADRLIIEDAGLNTVFSVDEFGIVGFNNPTPLYAADVVSPGAAPKSQLHFSLDGSDNGGYLISVNENNFFARFS